MPLEQMRRYRTVSSRASWGTCIQRAACGAKRIITTVKTTAARAKSRICPATTAAAPSRSRAPMALPRHTVTPMVSPVMSTVAHCIT